MALPRQNFLNQFFNVLFVWNKLLFVFNWIITREKSLQSSEGNYSSRIHKQLSNSFSFVICNRMHRHIFSNFSFITKNNFVEYQLFSVFPHLKNLNEFRLKAIKINDPLVRKFQWSVRWRTSNSESLERLGKNTNGPIELTVDYWILIN